MTLTLRSIIYFPSVLCLLAFQVPSAGAAPVYETTCTSNVGYNCIGGAPSETNAAHDETFTWLSGSQVTTFHSEAVAGDGVLNAYMAGSPGSGSAPTNAQTVAKYSDQIVLEWAGHSEATLALNVNLAGRLQTSGTAFSTMYIQSWLGSFGTGLFTNGYFGFDRYGPTHPSPGSRCLSTGTMCGELVGDPTPFDIDARTRYVTVPTNVPLNFVFSLIADISLGASGGLRGSAVADLTASFHLGDIFEVANAGFDGNIYATSGLINNNQWVNSAEVPEPAGWALLSIGIGFLLLTAIGRHPYGPMAASRPSGHRP